MTATEIIQELHRRGVELKVAGDRLRFRPKKAVTPDLLALLVQHKSGILAALTSDKLPGLCPGPEKCGGCYEVSRGIFLHPPKCSQDWLDWLRRWQPNGKGKLQ